MTDASVSAFVAALHRTGVGCVYVKDLADVDLEVLEEILRRSY